MKKHGVIKKCIALALGTTLIMGVAGCGSSGVDSGKEQEAGETFGTEAAWESSTAAQAPETTSAAGTETETTTAHRGGCQSGGNLEDTLIPMFEEANPGIQVEGTYASSGDLQQQIESGLEADLFNVCGHLQHGCSGGRGTDRRASVVNLLKNDVVLIVPEGVETEVTGFADLANADVVAIGDPESVRAGKYAKEILDGLGIYDAVAEKASLWKQCHGGAHLGGRGQRRCGNRVFY